MTNQQPKNEGWKEKAEEFARTLWRHREYECEIEAEEAFVSFMQSELVSARLSERQEVLKNINLCSDCKAQGIPEMVIVHLKGVKPKRN